MDAYEALVRAQAESSHRASLVALAAALLVIGAGLLIALVSEDSATKHSAAVMAAAGATTCGFIAWNFIRAQQRALDQMRCYLQQPLVQSYLLAAERIIGMMSNKSRDEQYKLILQSALAQTENVSHLTNVDGLSLPARRLPKMKLRGVAGGGEG
jgi:Na+/melibiose symporter-like transporter